MKDSSISKNFTVEENHDAIRIIFTFYKLNLWENNQFKVFLNNKNIYKQNYGFTGFDLGCNGLIEQTDYI